MPGRDSKKEQASRSVREVSCSSAYAIGIKRLGNIADRHQQPLLYSLRPRRQDERHFILTTRTDDRKSKIVRQYYSLIFADIRFFISVLTNPADYALSITFILYCLQLY